MNMGLLVAVAVAAFMLGTSAGNRMAWEQFNMLVQEIKELMGDEDE